MVVSRVRYYDFPGSSRNERECDGPIRMNLLELVRSYVDYQRSTFLDHKLLHDEEDLQCHVEFTQLPERKLTVSNHSHPQWLFDCE